MNDKDFKRLSAKVRKYYKKWVQLLGLGYWQCDIVYRRIPFNKRSDGNSTIAKAFCHWEYRKVEIEVSIPDIFDYKDEDIERMVIHELSHALVNEMREPDEDGKHEESVVCGITNALWWTHRNSVRKNERKQSR